MKFPVGRRLINGVSAAMGAVCGVVLLFILLLTCANVAMRYGFNSPILWAAQIATYGLVYLAFVGAPYALAQRAHVSVDIVASLLSAEHNRRLDVVLDVAGLLYCVAFAILAFQEIARVIKRGSAFVDALIVPEWMVLFVLPLSAVLLVVQYFANLLDDLDKLRPGHPGASA